MAWSNYYYGYDRPLEETLRTVCYYLEEEGGRGISDRAANFIGFIISQMYEGSLHEPEREQYKLKV